MAKSTAAAAARRDELGALPRPRPEFDVLALVKHADRVYFARDLSWVSPGRYLARLVSDDLAEDFSAFISLTEIGKHFHRPVTLSYAIEAAAGLEGERAAAVARLAEARAQWQRKVKRCGEIVREVILRGDLRHEFQRPTERVIVWSDIGMAVRKELLAVGETLVYVEWDCDKGYDVWQLDDAELAAEAVQVKE